MAIKKYPNHEKVLVPFKVVSHFPGKNRQQRRIEAAVMRKITRRKSNKK